MPAIVVVVVAAGHRKGRHCLVREVDSPGIAVAAEVAVCGKQDQDLAALGVVADVDLTWQSEDRGLFLGP